MKNFAIGAALSILLLSTGSSAFGREEKATDGDKARIDKIIYRLFQYDAMFPRRLCGVDYRGPSKAEQLAMDEMQIFKKNSIDEMQEMGPRAIPLLFEGLNANSRMVQETMIATLSEMGQPVLSEIEKGLNDGRISDFRGAGSDFTEVIEILQKSKTDNTALISTMLKSSNLNCRLFALKAMAKLKKTIPALNPLVEKMASDIHENVRAAAIEALAIDAKSNKSHFDLVCKAIENDETSLVRSRGINALSVYQRDFVGETKSKYDALILKVYQSDHVKRVRDYAKYSISANNRAKDDSAAPKFSTSQKDSMYTKSFSKAQPLDATKEASLDAAVSSILQQIKWESLQQSASYNPRKNTTPEAKGASNFNYYKYQNTVRNKEEELRKLGPDALTALINQSSVGNVDAAAACASTIRWFDYDALPIFANALEKKDYDNSLGYVICGAGERANAVFEQSLSSGSDKSKLNTLAILSEALPRLNYHKTIYHPIEVTPKLIKLIEKCMNSPNAQIQEEAKIVREQIDFSQCVLLTSH